MPAPAPRGPRVTLTGSASDSEPQRRRPGLRPVLRLPGRARTREAGLWTATRSLQSRFSVTAFPLFIPQLHSLLLQV